LTSFPFLPSGLLLVPNGKLLGQQLGDRYPGEEALLAAREDADTTPKWVDAELNDDAPGGRMIYHRTRQSMETRILEKAKVSFIGCLVQEPLKPRTAVKLQTWIGLSWTWAC
jgi:hypothetical protein